MHGAFITATRQVSSAVMYKKDEIIKSEISNMTFRPNYLPPLKCDCGNDEFIYKGINDKGFYVWVCTKCKARWII